MKDYLEATSWNEEVEVVVVVVVGQGEEKSKGRNGELVVRDMRRVWKGVSAGGLSGCG